MRAKVTVIGAHETARSLAERDHADVVESMEEIAGSDVVVVADDRVCADIARRAPAAVVVVAGDAEVCRSVLDETLFPRGRVIGVAGDGIDALVDAIVLDRDAPLECYARVEEHGEFVPATARIGERGIREFV